MRKTMTLTALVLAAVMANTWGQGLESTQDATGTAAARQGGPLRRLTIEAVKSGLYAIRPPSPTGPTVAVRVTSEGVILLDSMIEANYDQILTLTRTVTALPVKYVISTHHRSDHTGGNAQFLPYAQILGHKNARAAMIGASLAGPPPIYTTEAAVHLGGIEVQLHHLGPGHSDGDTVVYFPDLRVIATGDLFFMIDRAPVVDYANGGTAVGWLPTIDNILKFDFDMAIPGHGPVSTRADLVQFKQRFTMLQTRTRALIKQGVGKDLYLAKLKVDDLGWNLDPASNFVRNTASGFYDELAKAR